MENTHSSLDESQIHDFEREFAFIDKFTKFSRIIQTNNILLKSKTLNLIEICIRSIEHGLDDKFIAVMESAANNFLRSMSIKNQDKTLELMNTLLDDNIIDTTLSVNKASLSTKSFGTEVDLEMSNKSILTRFGTFTGQTLKGIPSEGTLTSYGKIYKGIFTGSNMEEFKGDVKFSDNVKFSGELKNMLTHKGTYEDGIMSFDGVWEKGSLVGIDGSIKYLKTGDTYCGDLLNVTKFRHGQGKYSFKNGCSIEGEWNNGRIRRGTFTNPNNKTNYTGGFTADVPNFANCKVTLLDGYEFMGCDNSRTANISVPNDIVVKCMLIEDVLSSIGYQKPETESHYIR